MATTYNHPGVYIEEVSSARSIQGASTSVAAFVGVTEFGPPTTPTLVTSWNDYVRHFGGLVWYGYVSWAVFEFFNEGGTACYIVRASDSANGASACVVSGGITATAVTPGSWGNSLQLAITDGSAQSSDKKLASPVFNLLVLVDASVIDALGNAAPAADPSIPVLQSFVLQNGPRKLAIADKSYYVLESFNGFTTSSMAANGDLMQRVNSTSMFVRVSTDSSVRPPNAVAALSGGSTTRFDLVAALGTLSQVQGISLLAVPDTVTATDANGTASQKQQATLINQALAFCEGQRNLFCVCDPPFGLDPRDMLDFKNGTGHGANDNSTALNSSFGAIYYPWVCIFNPMAMVNVPIPPSGPVLGRYAGTDRSVGVWKSPAGVSDGALRSVVDLATQLSSNDQDIINPAGINAIRNLSSYGNVVYGARTLALGSEWTYVAVRRLFIYVEQSLKQSLQWAVFEANGPLLWSAVSRDISAFLITLWQQGGLFGSTPAEAFFVTCDASNNPSEMRALGQLNIDIGLAPVFPAEFVIIRITQKTAGPESSLRGR